MTPSSRDRISVDLRGQRAQLFDRAKALGISPSDLVRQALTDTLGGPGVSRSIELQGVPPVRPAGTRVRVSLRMPPEQALALLTAARQAGLGSGDYVAGLITGVPVLSLGASRVDHIEALFASCAELSTLTRNIHHLTHLLRHGEVRAAQVYREMLDTLADDVRRHLVLASGVLAELRPRHGRSVARHSAPSSSE